MWWRADLSSQAPALEAVSDDYKTIRWNISALTPSKWAGPPSHDVDEAWNRYTGMGALLLSHDDLIRINASRYSVPVPKAVGDGYIAHVEWYHQLHCVYMLWQQTYPEWYIDEAKMKTDEPELWHEHLGTSCLLMGDDLLTISRSLCRDSSRFDNVSCRRQYCALQLGQG